MTSPARRAGRSTWADSWGQPRSVTSSAGGPGHAAELRAGDGLQGEDGPIGGHGSAGLEGTEGWLRVPRHASQAAPTNLVASCGALAAAPLWQVVRNPATLVQYVSVERILELELEARHAQECRFMPSTRHADAAASRSPRIPFHALTWKRSTGDKLAQWLLSVPGHRRLNPPCRR